MKTVAGILLFIGLGIAAVYVYIDSHQVHSPTEKTVPVSDFNNRISPIPQIEFESGKENVGE